MTRIHNYLPGHCLFLDFDRLTPQERRRLPQATLWFKPRYFLVVRTHGDRVLIAPLSSCDWGGRNLQLFRGERSGGWAFRGQSCYVAPETLWLSVELVRRCRSRDWSRDVETNRVLPEVLSRICSWLPFDETAA